MAAYSEPDEQKVRIPSVHLSGGMGAELAQNKAFVEQQQETYSQEKQVGSSYSDLEPVYHNHLGYSDLIAVEQPGLEVSGSDAAQVVHPPGYHNQYDSRPPDHNSKLGDERQHELSLLGSGGAAAAAGGGGGGSQYHGGKNPFDPAPSTGPMKNGRIWGLPRRTFWIVLGIVALAVVLALGVGIGVGVGLSSGDADSSARCVHSHNLLLTSSSPVLSR